MFKADKLIIAGGIVGKLRFHNHAWFNIYLKSNAKVLIQIKIETWVYNYNLKPNLLFGNDFYAIHSVVVNYPKQVITLASYKNLPILM